MLKNSNIYHQDKRRSDVFVVNFDNISQLFLVLLLLSLNSSMFAGCFLSYYFQQTIQLKIYQNKPYFNETLTLSISNCLSECFTKCLASLFFPNPKVDFPGAKFKRKLLQRYKKAISAFEISSPGIHHGVMYKSSKCCYYYC